MVPTRPVFLLFLLSKDFPVFLFFFPGLYDLSCFFYYFQVKILNFQVFSYIGFLQILENLENLWKIRKSQGNNLPVIITPLKTYLYGKTNFWMEVICLQHLLIEYFEKYIILKIANANSIFVDMKSIIQLSRWHFFAVVK